MIWPSQVGRGERGLSGVSGVSGVRKLFWGGGCYDVVEKVEWGF